MFNYYSGNYLSNYKVSICLIIIEQVSRVRTWLLWLLTGIVQTIMFYDVRETL